jgi:hypothetical protein
MKRTGKKPLGINGYRAHVRAALDTAQTTNIHAVWATFQHLSRESGYRYASFVRYYSEQVGTAQKKKGTA